VNVLSIGLFMRLLTYTVILFVFIQASAAICASSNGGRDVNDVSFRGDCTGFGMKIEGVYQADGAFLVTTTAARFEYAAGELKIYQGLGSNISRRLIATMTIGDVNEFEKVESNDDHVLFWSEKLNIGIYGDSTCVLAPKEKLSIRFKGNFKPDYEGRYKGELLLIDDSGGMEIYPQRYEAGYKVKKIELGKKNWVAEYLLNSGERVMIAAFPGREFDWEKSFNSHIVITTGGFGKKHPYSFGQMPENSVIEKWSKFLNIISVQYNGLWRSGKPWGPYVLANEAEFKRLIATAHQNNMKVLVYCSLYYYYPRYNDTESFYQQIKAIYDNYNIDGVYIDGLLFDSKLHSIDDKIKNWEVIRRFRLLFGNDGVVVLHDTSLGSPVSTVPNIDTYCDATLNCEGVNFKSVNDPYIKYQVRKYGISNTIGLWIRDKKPSHITEKAIIDALLSMNGREWWNGYVFWRTDKRNSAYGYYLKQLDLLKQAHSVKSQSHLR